MRPILLLRIFTLAAFSAAGSGAIGNPWDKAFGSGVAKQKPGTNSSAQAPRDLSRRTSPAAPAPAPAPVFSPAPAPAPSTRALDDVQARTDAASLVATFNAAAEAGAPAFATMSTTEQVVAALAAGIRGGGRFADTTFRVPGLDPARQAAALRHLRIERGSMVIGAPLLATPAATAAQKPDPRTTFAGGKLKVLVPKAFTGEVTTDGDLVMRGEGVQLALHLEAIATGLDAWAEVRAAAERNSLPLGMAGKKVYVAAPERRNPSTVTVGFGNTLVSMTIKTEPGSAGSNQLRLALPGIIRSLDLAK